MKRILCYLENYRPGGGEKYAIEFMVCLDPKNYQWILVSNPGGLSPALRQSLGPAVTCEEIPVVTQNGIAEKLEQRRPRFRRLILMSAYLLSPVFYLINIIRFMRLLARHRPDVVHSFNGAYPGARSSLAILLAARLMKIQAVLSVVGTPVEFLLTERVTGMLRDALIWRSVAVTIVNAESIRLKLINKHGFDAENILVVYNGLPDKFEADADRFRTEFGFPSHSLLIGCVTRMDFAKGPIYLVEAFRKLCTEQQNVHLVLVGQGNASEPVADLIDAHGLLDKVTMTGQYTGNVFDVLKSLDFFVFPSLSEGLPYSILEAMKAGCPIISTNVGGIGEAIRDGIEGLLVPPADVTALYEKMAYLARCPSEREKLGRNARQRFEACFEMSAMQARVQMIYDKYVSFTDC